jgi:N-sulfoglucosamine sulfohydrolase
VRTLFIKNSDDPEMQKYIRLCWAKRPAEELYDIKTDPYCMSNLIADPKYIAEAKELRERLNSILAAQGDPRIAGDDHYDNIEYFKTKWKTERSKYLKGVEPVHKAMKAAGWEHGRINPVTK